MAVTKEKSKSKKKSKDLHVVMLLDRSGSMSSIKDEIVSSFNSFVKDQSDGKTYISLYQFDTPHSTLDLASTFENKKAEDVKLKDGDYVPRGMTPLYDAIGTSVSRIEDESNILFVIVTDGLENASREYTRESVFDLIEKKKKDGWDFAYIGANQDAFAVGGAIGIDNTANWTTTNAAGTFAGVTTYATVYKSAAPGMRGTIKISDYVNDSTANTSDSDSSTA